jgi:hypothetical protein
LSIAEKIRFFIFPSSHALSSAWYCHCYSGSLADIGSQCYSADYCVGAGGGPSGWQTPVVPPLRPK